VDVQLMGCEEEFIQLLPRKPSVKEIVHFYRSQTRSTRPSMSRLTQDGDGELPLPLSSSPPLSLSPASLS